MSDQEFAFQLQRAVNNAAENADMMSRTRSQLSSTDTAVEHARALLENWTTSLPPAFREIPQFTSAVTPRTKGILEDLELAGLSSITEIDPRSVNSAGDFISRYLKEENDDELPLDAIHNTDAFIKRLMKIDLSKNIPKPEPKVNFREAQRQRVTHINEKREQRQKEAKIRLAAEKAAREEERKKSREERGKEQKRKVVEDKLLSAEINRLKTELNKEKLKTKHASKLNSMKELKKKQAEVEDMKRLQEERQKQMEQKIKLEAKNKIIIQQKIENHRRNRLYCLRRYFLSWSHILIERRKQIGMAQACRDWRLTRETFMVWRRRTKRIHNERIMKEEIQKARTLRLFESRVTKQKGELLMIRLFTAWRLFAKQEGERKRLLEAEQDMKDKMEKLLSKLKKAPDTPPQDVRQTSIQTCNLKVLTSSKDVPQIPPTQTYTSGNPTDIMSLKDEIHIQKSKDLVRTFQEEFIALKVQTLRTPKPPKNPAPPLVSKAIEAIVNPHKSVINMEQRRLEREQRRVEVLALKKRKQDELENAKKQKRKDENERSIFERRMKREELLAQKKAKEDDERLKAKTRIKTQENLQLAKDHYQRISKRKVLGSLKLWVTFEKDKRERIIRTCSLKRIRPIIINWQKHVRASTIHNQRIADHFRYKHLTTLVILKWKFAREIENFQVKKAETFRRNFLPRKCILLWSQHVIDNKVNEWRQEKLAMAHRNKILLSLSISRWTRLKAANALEKDRESRKSRLRNMVKEVLTDY